MMITPDYSQDTVLLEVVYIFSEATNEQDTFTHLAHVLRFGLVMDVLSSGIT